MKRPTEYNPDRIVALTDGEIDALREQVKRDVPSD